ncbi:periplasmic binding protein [Gordonia bronchialis DSM 43247]|uniref:Periplasmic binding protein n=1 Tax=Gordonia bronchialis (strain ATCC 25592 / DSM 43247 / BCRC 13721 / JCM 3198 / KCTC 3076 / NBRC 16047 / NCTC 10667) TaxID=526226 RepID=D0L2Q5_GORB4|nr:ABC transporter substrate-binding protein [Gordonia bronchialis]ACY20030.1 periplasmic binding protein [Gordonia bronchialis DSM 43247]MCC3322802.1 ABC transporter substrate-binding protein [Gordonia bronchialis]QGS26119.1 ABC transporter substrate-binding protein [Gordonia bronchialis]UAK37495.1 ABC transporter substrate-binding protein [Gordonia bronchialis]STQ62815.1 Uncharacterized ABC transporter solute-binding protein yclQ precursor [Gordonia bronchialis]
MFSRRTVTLVLTILALTLAGCSPGDDAASESQTVTIEHQYGSSTIPVNPTRVVTFGGAWSDSLIKLGVPITAEFLPRGYSGPNNRFEWTPEHTSTIVNFDYANGAPDIPAIARFDPQVILAGYLPDKATYDRLSQLAPTIPVMTAGTVTDSWQDVLSTAGKIFDKQAQAQEAITDVENQIAETKAKYPASQGTTFTFGQLTPQKQFGLVTSETDPSTKLVAQFGLQLDPAVKSLADQGPRTTVSGERVDLLDSDVLILWPLVGGAESFNSVPGWDQLPAVRNGTLVVLSNETASAFSSPTVYSVPWVVETMTPVLSKL